MTTTNQRNIDRAHERINELEEKIAALNKQIDAGGDINIADLGRQINELQEQLFEAQDWRAVLLKIELE